MCCSVPALLVYRGAPAAQYRSDQESQQVGVGQTGHPGRHLKVVVKKLPKLRYSHESPEEVKHGCERGSLQQRRLGQPEDFRQDGLLDGGDGGGVRGHHRG